MPLKSNEDRVTRRGPDGVLYQWSNAQEKPEGAGWLQASKASFPRVRTYLWFRPATYIDVDRKRHEAAKAELASPTGIEKLSAMMFRPWEYIKQVHTNIMAKKDLPSFKPHTRVTFNGQAYYTVGGVDALEHTIQIKNPVTGEIKTVNAKELSSREPDGKRFAVGDRVVLAKGSIDTKEQEVMVLGYDENTGTYKVSLDALSPKQVDIKNVFTVYPEAVDALIPAKAPKSKLALTDDLLNDPEEKRVIDALYRAAKQGRSSVQLKEIINDLRAQGQPIEEHHAVYALTMLNRIDPNIQYNSNSGGVYIGTAKDNLEQLMRAKQIDSSKESFGLVNLKQDSATDTYANPGIRVKSESGISGIIDTIVGDIAEVLTQDKKRVQLKLSELKDEFNRNLHVDAAAPRYVGNVKNKDIFWVIRDREGVKSVKEGDSVALLPGISNLQANKNQPISGRVVAVNNDGTVDMDAQVGDKVTRVRVFNRQLAKTPKLKDMIEFRDYLAFHKHSIPGSTVKVADTEVVFGDRNHQSITLNFANGEDYAKNEHLWFTPIESQANPSGWESVIRSMGSFWGESGDTSRTLAPSKEFLNHILDIYPGARKLTIARDTTTAPHLVAGVTSPIKFRVGVDSNMQGKTYSIDRLAEYYGKQSDKTPIPASSLGENNTVRMYTDGETLFLHLGKLFKEFKADHLPPIALHSSQIEALTDKQRKKYEESYGPTTFMGMLEQRMFNRQQAWGGVMSPKDIDNSGVFTYDAANDRIEVDMANYDEAHDFLKKFFGENTYKNHMYETEDRGYYGYAETKVLKSHAVPHERALLAQKRAKEDTAPIEIRGFYQGDRGVVLRPYQNAAVKFMLSNNSSLLAMDQGTGKSISAIAAGVEKLNRLNKNNPQKKHRMLVIAPAAVAQTSWITDLGKALEPKGSGGVKLPGVHNYTLLMGPDRTAAYKKLVDPTDNTNIAVTSFSTFALQDWQEIKDVGFDVVVIDEAQAISGNDNAGIITDRLQLMLSDIRHKIALTGTPLENSPEDLQAILAWLKPELFGDKAKFMNDFVDIDYVRGKDAAGREFPRKVGVRLKNVRSLRSKLNQIMFRVEKSDLPTYNQPGLGVKGTHVITTDKLPELVARYNAPDVDIATKARLGEISVLPKRSVWPPYAIEHDKATRQTRLKFDDAYNPITTAGYPEYEALVKLARQKMRAEYIRKLEAGEKASSQAYLLRMQQALNDPSLLAKEYGPEFLKPVANPKIDRLYNIVQNHFADGAFKGREKNGKIIIFAEHIETLKFLEKRLVDQFPQLRGRLLKYTGQGHVDMRNEADIKTRRDIESAFNNDPDFKYPIMLANNAAKTGVNLPAANAVINYDVGWNPQDINQRIDRAHRIRALKDVVASKTAPARDVTAHILAVTDPTGNVNYSVEARKLFTHKVKEQMFSTFIRGADVDEVSIPDDDFQTMTEELLDVATTPRAVKVDPERSRRTERAAGLKRTRSELSKRYGPLAKYLRAYSGESN